MFVLEGKDQRREIASMPGQFRLSTDLLVKEAGEVAGLGIPAVMLFGIRTGRTTAVPRRWTQTASCSARSKR